MITQRLKFIVACNIVLTWGIIFCTPSTPKVTVVVVIDQGAYHHFIRLAPHFQKGFKTLLQEGISYENAHHPHGAPVTATGHATISTGCLAKIHCVTGNSWPDKDDNSIAFGDDESSNAAVFNQQGTDSYGYSGHHILCESLSDLLKSHENPQQKFNIFALGNKPRAVVALAGHLGKAIWFDDETNQYTTGKAYFKELPQWLISFNHRHNTKKLKPITWKTRYPQNSAAYDLPFIDNYDFASADGPLVNTTIACATTTETTRNNGENDHENSCSYTPYANDMLFSLCQACIDAHTPTNSADHVFLWVTVSNLDMLGHLYGPYCREVVDLMYHLDWQIGNFLKYLDKKIGLKNVLFVLTADHGVTPIPELTQKQGFYTARRINSAELIEKMNGIIEETFQISNIVKTFKNNQFFFNKKIFTSRTQETQDAITTTLKNFLEQQPGIKHCWCKDDFKNKIFDPTSLEQFYKNQFYEPRSGDLICMPNPYTLITKYKTGTGHMSAHAYDTQVPLILYQKGTLEKKRITQRVLLTQVAPTLAKFYKVPQLPSSMAKPLPLR